MRLLKKSARGFRLFSILILISWSTAAGVFGGILSQTLSDQAYVWYMTYARQMQVAVIRQRSDHALHVTATVNGIPVLFLVDTGATSIRLTKSDAKRLGIDVDSLKEVVKIMTAGGIAEMKPTTLESVQIEGIEIQNVWAGIALTDYVGDENLLGMSFLGRLTRFEYSARQLILTK